MAIFFSKIIYSLVVECYHLLIAFFSFFNEKAYNFTKGRLDQNVTNFTEKTVWFHCASLGEFEQAKPIITWFYNNQKRPIIVTFFSPSGYVYKNNYPLARAVYYLPKDNILNATEFVKKINPEFAFFIKYDFWYFFLSELKKNDVKTYLVSGIFRKNQLFFKFYGALHKNMLKNFEHLFVQDDVSYQLLRQYGFYNCSIASDTRFDTVKQISELNFSNDIIEEFLNGKKCLVVGSSWQKDDLLISKNITSLKHYKLIIAPHDVNTQRIKQLTQLYPSNTLLSNPKNVKESKVLIIDNIGKLSMLYRYATICYIGGGFGTSIHNVLEAAVYGKPILFGPKNKKSKEAQDLLKMEAAFEIIDDVSFQDCLARLNNASNYFKASNESKKYVLDNLGGTNLIINEVIKK